MTQNIQKKVTEEFLKVKKLNILQWPSQSPDFNPIEHAFNLLNDKTKGRKTHKQGTTEVSCSKGLAKHPEGGNPWVPDLRQSLPAKDSQQNIKNENFIYDYIYLSNYIWAPENGGIVYKNGKWL